MKFGTEAPEHKYINPPDDLKLAEAVTSDTATPDSPTGTSIAYIGLKEDHIWWNVNMDDEDDNNIYDQLQTNMGTFTWQRSHGFGPGQNQGLSHIKAKWNNIKEEALNNEYHAISKDNWNQTLRKSKVFYQSWARQKIRTKYDGYFDDQVTGQRQSWKAGIDITMQEIVTLKLYTDFDKLQAELKKCFRSVF